MMCARGPLRVAVWGVREEHRDVLVPVHHRHEDRRPARVVLALEVGLELEEQQLDHLFVPGLSADVQHLSVELLT